MASRKRVVAGAEDARSLGSVLEHLVRGSTAGESHLRWPPDVFAMCGYLLKLTGAYVEVLREWPPQARLETHPAEVPWTDWIRKVGQEWRAVATFNGGPLPASVVELWRRVVAAQAAQVGSVAVDRGVVGALLQLVAMADEASVGAGIPQGAPRDAFRDRADELLAGIDSDGESTLSPLLSRAEVRVLPKQHKPRGGLTLRSLTHHLALHVGSEVTPFWYTVPQSTTSRSLNLLVAPWPLTLRPSQFRPANGRLHDMPANLAS